MRIYLTKYNLIKFQVLKIKSKSSPAMTDITTPLDCACVLHGTAYDWSYVDKLYSMLCRNLSRPINLHVYTEVTRPVPAPYIKHELVDWKFKSARQKSWWYKLQMFNSQNHAGPLLYFDLDVVIVQNIDWLVNQNLRFLWGIRDFKTMYKPHITDINSSVMYWDTCTYDWIWQQVLEQGVNNITARFHGDQDFLSKTLNQNQIRYFTPDRIKSWRWQCLDGGYDFKKRRWNSPGAGTHLDVNTDIMVFHGKPKPHEIHDHVVQRHWQ
jgi:hypothetical protein